MNIAVTGAFGYSGRYIAQKLLDTGHAVLTLTNSISRRNPFGNRVRVVPFNFEQPALLVESLRNVDVLINTYWVRFDHKLFTHAQAVTNTMTMFEAAKQAGVKRIVHVSITNPDLHSPLPYFRGKAQLENELTNLGLSYCILRPTVLFGKEDVLINNIAWGLKHLPVFGVFGKGDYKLQPIYVEDLANTAVEKALENKSETIEAIGPETFTYREMVEVVGRILGVNKPILSVPPALGYWSCRLLGALVGDVVITREEIRGLMENRLYVEAPALGTTKLTKWIEEHKATLGRHYTSEMARRLDRQSAYGSN